MIVCVIWLLLAFFANITISYISHTTDKRNKMLSKMTRKIDFNGRIVKGAFLTGLLVFSGWGNAQSVEQVRWKSESQVREILGEPNNITAPVGTHATYTMWKYDNFTVAFANSKAFHLFNVDSLRKVELNEGSEQ